MKKFMFEKMTKSITNLSDGNEKKENIPPQEITPFQCADVHKGDVMSSQAFSDNVHKGVMSSQAFSDNVAGEETIKPEVGSQIEMLSTQFNYIRDLCTGNQIPTDHGPQSTENIHTPDTPYYCGLADELFLDENCSYGASSPEALNTLTEPDTTAMQVENYETIQKEEVPVEQASDGIEDSAELHKLVPLNFKTIRSKISTDGLDVPALENHSHQKPSDAASPAKLQHLPQQQSTLTLPVNQQNFQQNILNRDIKSKIPTATSSVNRIIIHSNELFKLPPVGTVIQIPSNNLVKMKSHQINLTSPTMNDGARISTPLKKGVVAAQKSKIPRAKASLPKNIPKSRLIPVARAQSTPKLTKTIHKKNAPTATYVPPTTSASIHIADDADWSALPTTPIQLGLKRNSTPTTANQPSLKRKNEENNGRVIPAKLLRVKQAVKVAKMEVTPTTKTVSLPQLTITHVDADGAKQSVTGVSLTYSNRPPTSENRSFEECLKMLERNGCTIVKVQKKASSNVAFEKIEKIFAASKVLIKSLNKN